MIQAPNTPWDNALRLDALTLGLYLALTAPTTAKSQEAAALAEKIAAWMTASVVVKAKADAVARFRAEEAL